MNQEFIDKNYEIRLLKEGKVKVHGKELMLDPNSLYFLKYTNKFRHAVIWFIEWNVFERFIILTIALNSIILAIYDYENRTSSSYNNILDIFSFIFNGIFIFECILKIIARGLLCHQSSYLRDWWNILDFVVVISAILEMLPIGGKLRSIRALRVIRPLRTINAVPSMKKLVKVLLKSIPNLGNVIFLLSFMMLMFGILGLHVFSGDTYSRCRTTEKPINSTYWPILQEYDHLCQKSPNTCPTDTFCGHPNDYNMSLDYENVSSTEFMQYGIVQFDNIGSSFLTVFEVLTIFGWSGIMYNYMESTNVYFSAFFFAILVLFGAFFLLNLILAVIVDAYNKIDMKEKKKEQDEMEEEAQKRAKRLQAIKCIYRMMRLSQKKKEIIESSGCKFRWSFFDVVFELVRVERYEKIINSPLKTKTIQDKLKDHFKNININIINNEDNQDQNDKKSPVKSENNSNSQKKDSSPNAKNTESKLKILISSDGQEHDQNNVLRGIKVLGTIQENQQEEDEMEESKFSQSNLTDNNNEVNYSYSVPGENANKISTCDQQNLFTRKMESTFLKSEKSFLQIDKNAIHEQKNKKKQLTYNFDETINKMSQTQLLQQSSVSNDRNLDQTINKQDDSFSVIMGKQQEITDNQSLRKGTSNKSDPKEQSSPRTPPNLASKQSFGTKNSYQDKIRRSKSFNHEYLASRRSSALQISPKQIENEDDTDIIVQKQKLSILKRIQQTFQQWVEQIWFIYLMNFLIIGNTIIMSMDRYPIPISEKQFQTISNLVFYCIFVIELVIKLVGLGPKGYFRDNFNRFDSIIIFISTVDIILNSVLRNSSSTILSILRGFRILRLLKIARSQQNMQDFQQTIHKTLIDLRNFSILLFLVMFTYTLVSLEFFAFKVKFNENDEYDIINGESPRLNFDGFAHAFSSVFIILQGEGYHIIMYNIARSVGKWSIIFFVTLIIFGNIILLKLFLAVLLENFEDKRKEIEELKKKDKRKKPLPSLIKKFLLRQYNKLCCFRRGKDYLQTTYGETEGAIGNNQNSIMQRQNSKNQSIEGKSLFMFTFKNRFRIKLNCIIESKVFEFFILFLILLSCILLAIENPFDATTSRKQIIIDNIDRTITIIFCIEVFLKILAKGLIINGPTSYLRNFWGVFDFLIVLISLLAISFPDNSKLKIFKVLRLVRVLRPLRVIGRNQGLRLAVQTLLMAIPHILNVLFVSCIFYLIFGIFCVQFLKGEFQSCYISHIEPKANITAIITQYDCINIGGEWINEVMNFDNALKAMELLYSINTVSWNTRMLNAIDATGIGFQPKPNTNLWWILYFLIYMIFFVFFILNLFVSVVVGTFNTEKERLGKNFLLTETQKEWLHMKMILLNTKPVIIRVMNKGNIIKKICFKITASKYFEWSIFIIIVLNTLNLTIQWYQIPQTTIQIVTYINYTFTFLFTLEAIIKIIGLGIKPYFRENWNIFDFIILTATLVGIILDNTTQVSVGGKATLVRAFRVVRIFRLVKRAKVLKIIIDTLIVSLPSLMNIGGLLVLILYIYSVLGMQLFSFIKLKHHLNERANFQTFGRSFLTLIRIATGEEWDTLLDDMTEDYSIINQCDHNYNVDSFIQTGQINGCGDWSSYVFILSFNFIVTVIFLNLFAAIVLQSFEEMNQQENKILCDQNMDHLRKCWSDFDQEGTFFIKITDFAQFLSNLSEPLGFSEHEKASAKGQDDFMKNIMLDTYNKFQHYYYYDVVQNLARYAYVKAESAKKQKELLMKENFNFNNPSLDVLTNIKDELEFKSEQCRNNEIKAFKEIMDKERKLYSGVQGIKDDLDSQHLMAAGRIKNMQGKVDMNFKGGLTSGGQPQLLSRISSNTNNNLNNNEGSKKNSIHTPNIKIDVSNLNDQPNIDKNQPSLEQTPQLSLKRKKSIWKTLSKAIDSFDEQTDNHNNLKQNSASNILAIGKFGSSHSGAKLDNNTVISNSKDQRRSTIFFPVITPQNKKRNLSVCNSLIDETQSNFQFENNLSHLGPQKSEESISSSSSQKSIEQKDIPLRINDELQNIDLITSQQTQNEQTQHQKAQPKQKTFHLPKLSKGSSVAPPVISIIPLDLTLLQNNCESQTISQQIKKQQNIITQQINDLNINQNYSFNENSMRLTDQSYQSPFWKNQSNNDQDIQGIDQKEESKINDIDNKQSKLSLNQENSQNKHQLINQMNKLNLNFGSIEKESSNSNKWIIEAEKLLADNATTSLQQYVEQMKLDQQKTTQIKNSDDVKQIDTWREINKSSEKGKIKISKEYQNSPLFDINSIEQNSNDILFKQSKEYLSKKDQLQLEALKEIKIKKKKKKASRSKTLKTNVINNEILE